MTFIPAIIPDSSAPTVAHVFLFNEGQSVLIDMGVIPRLMSDHRLLKNAIYLGTYDGDPCYVARLEKNGDLPTACEPAEIRALHGQLPDELYALVGYASQILTWSENHQFCSRCGSIKNMMSCSSVPTLGKFSRRMMC